MPFFASTLVIAAVSVVLPWSTCPIVPTFTCGLLRSNFCFAIATDSRVQGVISVAAAPAAPFDRSKRAGGAHDRNRTDDLLLTMEMLYRLSYVGARGRHHPRGRQGSDAERGVVHRPMWEDSDEPE